MDYEVEALPEIALEDGTKSSYYCKDHGNLYIMAPKTDCRLFYHGTDDGKMVGVKPLSEAACPEGLYCHQTDRVHEGVTSSRENATKHLAAARLRQDPEELLSPIACHISLLKHPQQINIQMEGGIM